MSGFWDGLGAPALVDWCEANYAASPYVAEWWNTLSSLGMVLIGVEGLWRMRRLEARFWLGQLSLALIGLGSMAFHGTLLRIAQAADELPMVWAGLACVWALIQRDRPPGSGRPLALGLAGFGLMFCVAYAVVPWAFTLFLAVYAGMVVWVGVRSIQLTWFRPSSQQRRRVAAWWIAGYHGGFFMFWMPEHVLLGCDHPAQT